MTAIFLLWVSKFIPKGKDEGRTAVQPKKPQADKMRRTKEKQSPQVEKEDVSPGYDLEDIAEQIRLKSVAPDLTSVKDPFKRLELTDFPLEFSDLVLSGIIFEEEMPTALINGQILKEGDRISVFRVEEIRRNSVILTSGDDQYTLRLSTGTQKE